MGYWRPGVGKCSTELAGGVLPVCSASSTFPFSSTADTDTWFSGRPQNKPLLQYADALPPPVSPACS